MNKLQEFLVQQKQNNLRTPLMVLEGHWGKPSCIRLLSTMSSCNIILNIIIFVVSVRNRKNLKSRMCKYQISLTLTVLLSIKCTNEFTNESTNRSRAFNQSQRHRSVTTSRAAKHVTATFEASVLVVSLNCRIFRVFGIRLKNLKA
jgi:hypothetical protein